MDNGVEVLWTAALALLCVTLGDALLPWFIRMLGKSGRIESVEWAIFLALGIVFPVAAAVAGQLAVRLRSPRMAVASVFAGIGVAFHAGWFIWRLGFVAFILSAIASALVLAVAVRFRRESLSRRKVGWIGLVMVALTAVWEAAFRLASWTDAEGWITQSVRTPILAALVVVAATITLVPPVETARNATARKCRFVAVDTIAILALVVLSFRTTPTVEFDHWSFWVGPIESVRQGGWLLWDVPSQYGFISILLPTLVPTRDAWQSLYLVQAALYTVTAIAIYAAIATLRAGFVPRLFAFAFTATAYFFRPRTFHLVLPAQMTPAGGPMRFFWCYAILGVLIWKYRRGDAVSDVKFAAVGTLVWLASVAWSSESAIYTSVAWGAAYVVFLLQRMVATRSGNGVNAQRILHFAAGMAFPVIALIATALLVTLAYVAFDGHAPDWMSYYEYAVLFTGGYGALPIEAVGVVWYVVALFIVVSAVVVRFLTRDPSNPGLFVAVGAWGTVWAVSSYFVARSHPVNPLSLVPLLVFSLAIALHLLRSMRDDWTRLFSLVAVPLFAMPAVLTLSHRGFPGLLLSRQAPMSALTAQVPAMDSSLANLARAAGMRPEDPVFFAGDARYVMPRWPELKQGRARTNELAWVPKPYEIINIFPQSRRDEYVGRFQRRFDDGGWVVQKKPEINSDYEGLLRLIEKSFSPGRTLENDQWLVVRYAPKGVP